MQIIYAAIMIFVTASSQVVQAHLPVSADLLDLDKVLCSYPPDINSEEELKHIDQKWKTALTAVNEQLKEKPEDITLIMKRGQIYRLGHNMDQKGALNAAEADFKTILDKAPDNENALVELGTLYINSGYKLGEAEDLFKRAQKVHGESLLEPAQYGLFFTYYYQGRMKEALTQAELMNKNWPKNTRYARNVEIVKTVIEKANNNPDKK